MLIQQLTFTRFVAAITVVIFHYGLNIFPFNHPAISFIFENGDLFVSYFFVLSGFVMFVAYHDQKIAFANYLKRRVARIYPIHLVGLLLLFLSYSIYNRVIPPGDVLFQATLLHPLIPRFSLIFNYPAWSLGAEMFFYTAFPALLTQFLNVRFYSALIAVLLCWFGTQITSFALIQYFNSNQIDYFVFYHPIMHTNEFLIGILFGLMYVKGSHQRKHIKWQLLLNLVIILTLMKFQVSIATYKNGFLAPLFGYQVFLLSSLPVSDELTKILSTNKLIELGEISFAIYILQVPIYNLAYILFREIGLTNVHLSFYIYLCLLVATSYFSYHIIEMPAKEIINRIKLKR